MDEVFRALADPSRRQLLDRLNLDNGQTLREWTVVASEMEIEVAPGVFFPGWVYNGQCPGPTLEVHEGDHVMVEADGDQVRFKATRPTPATA